MLSDPGFWLFGLALVLLSAGILGVVLSTRRVPPAEAPEVLRPFADPQPGEERVHELEVEVERLRAERDELQSILGRLAALLGRAPGGRAPGRSAARRPELVPSGDDGEHQPGGG
jgi:hypothetical protein